ILLRRGAKMDAPRSKEMLTPDMSAVMSACRKHDKFGVMVGFGAEMLTHCVQMGYHLIVSGGDVPFLATTSKKTADEARAVIKSAKTEPAVCADQGRNSGPY